MKTILTTGLVTVLGMASATALAAHPHYQNNHGMYDKAKVISAEPITRLVRVAVPQQECYTEEVITPVYTGRSDGAALAGGIVGGVLGHKIGDGRKGATLAGAIIGAAVGKNLTRHQDSYYEQVSYVDRCDTHTAYHMEERIEGYHVTYRYKGRIFTTRTEHDPGRFIPVRVDVSPIRY